MTPTEFITQFTQDRHPSPHTSRAYTDALEAFQTFYGSEDISIASESDVRAFIATLEAKACKRISVYTKLIPIRLYFKALHDSGEIPATPFARINYGRGKEDKQRQKSDQKQRVLTTKDVEALRKYEWPVGDHDALRMKMAVRILTETGRRVHDLCGAMKSDLNLAQKEIGFRRTKSGFGQGISVISKGTAELIREVIELPEDGKNPAHGDLVGLTPDTVRHWISRALDDLFIKQPGMNAHAIKHWYVTHLLEKGVPIDIIAEQTGTSPQTLLTVYSHPSKERMHSLLEGVWR